MKHQVYPASGFFLRPAGGPGLRIALSLVAVGLATTFPAGPGLATAIGVAFILAGIPHGAADHLVFHRVTGRRPGLAFLVAYGLLIAAYGLLWWLLPTLALLFFLVFSAYHFGQTQLAPLALTDGRGTSLLYLCWGTAVLATPLALHFPDTAAIVAELIGYRPRLPVVVLAGVPLLGLAAVVGLLLRQWRNGRLAGATVLGELGVLLVIGLVFVTHGLLTGFAFFFLVWHTWPALADQRRLLQDAAGTPLSVGTYARQLWPLSAGAFLTLGLLFLVGSRLGPGALSLASFFVFISLISLPHALLMDRLYRLPSA